MISRLIIIFPFFLAFSTHFFTPALSQADLDDISGSDSSDSGSLIIEEPFFTSEEILNFVRHFTEQNLIFAADDLSVSSKGDQDRLKQNTILLNYIHQEIDLEKIPEDQHVKEFPFEIPTFQAALMTPVFARDFFDNADLVCLKKGTPIHLVPYYFEAFTGAIGDEEFQEWYNTKCLSAELGIVNFYPFNLDVYWIHPRTQEKVFQGKVEPGEPNTFWRSTFLGHQFLVTSSETAKAGSDAFEAIINVDCDEIKVFGSQETQVGTREDLDEAYKKAIHDAEMKRAARIERTFTKNGYERIKTPKRLLASVRTFWHNNRNNLFEEIWKNKSVYVNYWTSTPKMAVVPFGLKAKWHDILRPVLEKWADTELIPTDLYGIRVYYNQSWLLDHVDRHETHAVSAIINVEQDVDEDWELEIYNLNGTIIHSPLYEGESMLYESAKVMHGRPKPLNGKYYANVFFHYRPADRKTWWTKETTYAKDEL